jgi:hypothetical protein
MHTSSTLVLRDFVRTVAAHLHVGQPRAVVSTVLWDVIETPFSLGVLSEVVASSLARKGALVRAVRSGAISLTMTRRSEARNSTLACRASKTAKANCDRPLAVSRSRRELTMPQRAIVAAALIEFRAAADWA